MNKDFSAHQKIIDRFRGRVNTREFENKFTEASVNIPKTERFLLKMELKRLAGPCTRLIDLRGHVEGDCDLYEHEGRTHFLDTVAIRVFEENLDKYGGYTFGVYEAVNNTDNNFRVIYQKEKNQFVVPVTKNKAPKLFDKIQYPAKFFNFGDYQDRVEERMNFAISLSVMLPSGKVLEANSIDISISGCRFRFAKPQLLAIGQKVQIEFTGFTQEFSFGEQTSFEYQICNLHREDSMQLVGVNRIYLSDKDNFKEFLQGYIQGNKRRYKINLDNTIAALQSRTYEQFSLPKSNELPVFLAEDNGQYIPRYVLTTNNSQTISQYWQDERHYSTLNCLMNSERIERLKKAARLGRKLIVYSFVHESQGKKYFYTADDRQLAEDSAFMRQFLAFAASKSHFEITELSYFETDIQDAHTCFTVSNTLPKNLSYLKLPITEEEKLILASLSYGVVATKTTTERAIKEYKSLSFEGIDTSKIKRFGHKREQLKPVVDYLGINYKNQRAESRFIYKTPIQVTVDDVLWSGISKDFSISGIKVQLDKAAVLKKGEVVYLTFPNLQKITSAFDLKGLPYEVIRISDDKTILNLRVFVEKHQHIGRSFFKALIEKNKSKLTPDEFSMMSPGVSKGLRNMYAKSTPHPVLYVQTSGSRYKIDVVAGNGQTKLLTHMQTLSDRPNHLNLYPLLNNQQVTNLLKPTMKSLHSSHAPVTDVLYISIKEDIEFIDKAVITKMEREFGSSEHKRMFIDNALKHGSFYCILVKICRADEPDMDHLNPELSYIGSYAIHRGKQLEQDIWSTVGVIQCIDITKETLLRSQLVSGA